MSDDARKSTLLGNRFLSRWNAIGCACAFLCIFIYPRGWVHVAAAVMTPVLLGFAFLFRRAPRAEREGYGPHEWCEIAREVEARGDSLIDEDWMIGWFANAIENAKDHLRREVGLVDSGDAYSWTSNA